MPGKHSLEGALPISTILRDYLKVCDNNREAKIILHNRDVFVDQRVVNKPKYPVGLRMLFRFQKLLHVRAMLMYGRIEFVPIKAVDSKWKLDELKIREILSEAHKLTSTMELIFYPKKK